MGITSSLVTGLSGLSTAQSQIDVVGNNIANVNTVGFKSSRLDFKTQFLENFSYGSAPSGTLGGTNPLQIGLGTQAGAISRNFGDGSLQVTGVDTNLAVQGNGMFVLQEGSKQVYTRDGSFQLNGLNQLVSGTGQLVQGFGVDTSFNVVPGVLTSLTIPVGSLTVAQATQNANLTGNLDSAGVIPSTVADLTLNQPMYLSDGAGGVDALNPPTGATALTSVTDAGGAAMFQVGDVIKFSGMRGTQAIKGQTLTVTATTTLSDLQDFMAGTLGIDTAAGANGSVATAPGVSLGGAGNSVVLTIDGNPGTTNDLTLASNALNLTRGGSTLSPFTFTKNGAADGESIATTLQIYDSLGTPVNVNVVATLESKGATGSNWHFYATSPDSIATGANTQTVVGEGTLSYDTSGHLLNAVMPTITIDRVNSGALANLTVTLDFTHTTALSGSNSQLASTFQDGSAPGTLTTFSIGNDGMILGSFSNGLSRKVGQVALATFRNDQGLIDQGSNTFTEGPNSGTAIISAPTQFSAGRIVAGSVELSNVDLSGEFVQLIAASTAFSASSKVITSSNQLLQELLSATR
jgi:flagellar hook protein FlgE